MAIKGYIWIKQGAVVDNLKKPITRAIQISSNIYFSNGYSLFITSGEEGNHSAGSLHYVNLAFDSYPAKIIRPNPREIEYFNNKIGRELGKDYDLVDHKGSHIHIEFDPKR